MQFKILNINEITEENKIKFLKYIDETSKDFNKKAYEFISKSYSIKNIFKYKPSKTISKISIYIISFGLIVYITRIINEYINIMLYNIGSINTIILYSIASILQFLLLCAVLYLEMTNDKNYDKQCHEKLIKSEFNQKFIKNLLEKAKELNIIIEVINEGDNNE